MEMQTLMGCTGAGDLKATAVVNPDTESLTTGYYGLPPDQATFFKAETGIDNEDDLQTHILKVQKKAFKVSDVIYIILSASQKVDTIWT